MNQVKLAGLNDAAQSNSSSLPVGTVVGASRWPMSACHPGCWQKPWKGVVIALNDPRAWEGNTSLKTQSDIDRHIARCKDQGLFRDDVVAVLWDFGDKEVVYFSSTVGQCRVRPYAEDYLAWQAAREAAYRNDRALTDIAIVHH